MKKLSSLGIGFMVGSLIAMALVALFAPISGKELREQLKESYQETMADARRASSERQRELEAELARKLGKKLLPGEPAHAAPTT